MCVGGDEECGWERSTAMNHPRDVGFKLGGARSVNCASNFSSDHSNRMKSSNIRIQSNVPTARLSPGMRALSASLGLSAQRERVGAGPNV